MLGDLIDRMSFCFRYLIACVIAEYANSHNKLDPIKVGILLKFSFVF